jgi:hypothetical protein
VTVGPRNSFFGNPDAVWAGEQAVGDEHLVTVVTFLGHPTVAEAMTMVGAEAAAPLTTAASGLAARGDRV